MPTYMLGPQSQPQPLFTVRYPSRARAAAEWADSVVRYSDIPTYFRHVFQ